MHLPNLPKGPLLAIKWAKHGVFVGGLRGVKFKKSTFLVQKVHFLGVLHPPKNRSWLYISTIKKKNPFLLVNEFMSKGK